jgi:hypothetical protein
MVPSRRNHGQSAIAQGLAGVHRQPRGDRGALGLPDY